MTTTPMKKQALLIGINEYQILPELKYARQDAEAVEQALKQNYCFSDDEVMLLTDAKPGLFKPTDRYIIQDHLEKLANQDLDLFIFGFWGHGLFRNGKRYLCPLNVMGNRADRQGLPFDELQELLANIKAKNTCLILDCCQTIHDRGEAETLSVSEQTSLENIARDIVLRRKEQIPDFKSNVAILNSCKEGQSAYEWDARQHGLFTAYLLDAMKKRSNSVMQIASYISSNIEKTALELGKQQTPFYKLEGDIVLPVETKSTPLVTGDVFISYRHCNADLVAPIEAELKRRGISYFIDRVGVNYSMEYSTVIARAIKACKVLLVMWTKEANDSPDMLQEIVAGLQLKKKVLPYKLGTFDVTEHDALFLQLSPLSRCEAVSPTQDSVTELINRIQQLLGLSSSIPSSFVPQTKPEPAQPQPPKPEESNPFRDFIEEEKRKKQKQIQKLLNEALESYKKEEFNKAIATLDVILKLEPNSKEAKDFLSICQSRLEFQKAEEERKIRAEEQQKAEEERKRREAEEAERKRKAEEQRKAEEERKRREAEEAERKRRELEHRMEEDRKRREEIQRALSIPGTKAGERKTVTVNGVEFAFRWCPPGTFMMGSPKSEEGHGKDENRHQVTLTSGFWMMETQVTQKQWKAIMGNNPSRFKGDDLPVEHVSRYDCQEFCMKCTQLGLLVQLPTEAQWEYACRAGSTTKFFWGNTLNGDKANCDGNYPSGTETKGQYLKKPISVISYEPNAWGLYNMHGNVWEWCSDWYATDYPNGSVTDPTGPSSGSCHVRRGGCWSSGARDCRSACRFFDAPGGWSGSLGFRLAKTINRPE